MFKKRVSRLLSITMTIGLLLLLSLNQAQAYVGNQTLKIGVQGNTVSQLQKDLGYLGYKVGAIDGIYSWQTQQAVRQFQNNNGLTADGIVGPLTAQSINKQVTAPAPSRGSRSF
ncbi:MAG: spore cortex-lytic enzyme, partial [Syntrophomonadaceae bacterium]|nr:spore cortex-lytic enzyme [Syntrophomonadaceae bacterium]